MSKQKLFEQLSKAVIEGDEELAIATSREVVAKNLDATEAIFQGLAKGMEVVGQYFETQKYFLPEVVVSAEAFKRGVEILKPHIKVKAKSPGSIVLGTVYGDTHDIGKNIVAIIFEAAGYTVYDLGRDVPPQVFVDKVKETKADVLGLSALMTTSMTNMKVVIDLLVKEGIRNKVKVIVGGATVTHRFAKEIKADAYGQDAIKTLRLVNDLLSASRKG